MQMKLEIDPCLLSMLQHNPESGAVGVNVKLPDPIPHGGLGGSVSSPHWPATLTAKKGASPNNRKSFVHICLFGPICSLKFFLGGYRFYGRRCSLSVCVNIWIQPNALRKFGCIEISQHLPYYTQANMWEKKERDDEIVGQSGFEFSKNF